MQKLHFTVFIKAPQQKVWDTMLGADTYQKWADAFGPGPSFKGDWNQGSKIMFIGVDPKTGEEGGMVSYVKESRPYEFISLEHRGIIVNGVEDTTSAEARKWTPAYENYTLLEKEGGTELLVDSEIAEDHKEMFEDLWPKALQKLKELCEK